MNITIERYLNCSSSVNEIRGEITLTYTLEAILGRNNLHSITGVIGFYDLEPNQEGHRYCGFALGRTLIHTPNVSKKYSSFFMGYKFWALG